MFKAVALFMMISSSLLAGTIKIAVAANVSYAIEALKTEFNRMHPDIRVIAVLGSSGKLTAQIRNGAPYGLFMSANMRYPQALFDEKIAITKPLVYAKGALAYLSAKERDFSSGIGVLTDDKIKKIAIANPKTAPYGKASVDAMKKAGIYDRIKNRLVYAESISQAVAYAMTAADIGLIAKSSLYSPKMLKYKEHRHWMSVDESLYSPIRQGMVLLRYAQEKKAYQDFYDFMSSPEAKTILKRYGYTVE